MAEKPPDRKKQAEIEKTAAIFFRDRRKLAFNPSAALKTKIDFPMLGMTIHKGIAVCSGNKFKSKMYIMRSAVRSALTNAGLSLEYRCFCE